MDPEGIATSLQAVRRLAVTRQHLAGKLAARDRSSSILSTVRDLPYVQWDAVNIVAPSHLLSLWARIGGFRSSSLERLLWDQKRLFLHWTPIASIVLSEDYPLYYSLMRRYPESLSGSWGSQRTRAQTFLSGHSELRKKIGTQLRNGPLTSSQIDTHARTKPNVGGWSFGSDVSLMLFHMLMSGEVMVVGHQGNQNLWGLSDQFLPEWVVREEWSEAEVDRTAAQRAIRALGTATPTEINYYFVRGRYQNLRKTLRDLQDEKVIHRVRVAGISIREERYVLEEDLPLLDSLGGDAWQPRLSLLPPFDNLIYSQERTSRLFGFNYVREQFLPKEKRKFGTYVLPILWGDRLIGRIDPRLDRGTGKLVINSVHAEPECPRDREVPRAVEDGIPRLAQFIGASGVTYTSRVPGAWKSTLH